MIAVKRLQSLFWVLVVAIGALSAYLVSLRVATERNELNRVRTEIARTRANIRYLETEYASRSSMRQLEKWNADDFRYSTPSAAQYLGGEQALASLDGIQPNGPAYVAAPVMVAMVETPPDTGAAALAVPVKTVTVADAAPSPAPTQIRSELSLIRSAHAQDVMPAAPRAARKDVVTEKVAVDRIAVDRARPNPVARKAERMAMLDAQLLDSGTLGDLAATAAREKRKGQR